jgi:hypothetical protein
LVRGHWKYITDDLGNETIYDLSADPDEQRNVFQEQDPFHLELRSSLAAWMEAVPEFADEPVQMDAEEIDHLRSLGYIR